MIGIVLLSVCCSVLAANAASLQNPTISTANYTTYYIGGQNFLNSINNNGVAVGEHNGGSEKFDPAYALVYENFQVQQLYGVPSSGLDQNGPRGINDKGTYVGYGYLPGSPSISGFVGSYASTNMSSPIVTFNVPGAVATYPYAVNNQGTIVGGYVSGTDGLEHGFIYRADGSFQNLDDPTYRNTALTGINNLGQIVGAGGSAANNFFPLQGFLYSANSFIDFSYGQPVGINDLGAIAINTSFNTAANGNPQGGGVLYPDGTLDIVIAATVFSGSPSIGPALSGINNRGTLLFNSAYAFIATPVAPVPEPSSLALMTAGLLSLVGGCVWRRRRAS